MLLVHSITLAESDMSCQDMLVFKQCKYVRTYVCMRNTGRSFQFKYFFARTKGTEVRGALVVLCYNYFSPSLVARWNSTCLLAYLNNATFPNCSKVTSFFSFDEPTEDNPSSGFN